MSARVHRRLQASIEYMVLGDLAQCVLNALWRAGHEQRFEPLGSLTARDVILVRLRQLGMLQREGAGVVLDELLAELRAACALVADGDVLVLPILSADKPRVPRVPSPAAPALTPEEAAQRQDEERRRENFERAFREYRRARRATGDARADAVLREEFRGVYREKRGRGARTSAEPPAEAPRRPEDPGHEPPPGPPHPPAEGSSPLSLSSENSQEREERETPEEDVVARARAELGAADPRAEDPAPRRIRPEDRRDGGGYGRGEDPPREHPERESGGSAPSPEGTAGAPPTLEDLSDRELGVLGLKGLELAGRALKAGPPVAQVQELGALMREHGLTPEQFAGAGRFLGQVDVRKRYDWEATVAAKGEVTLHFLLGKRLADGRREGDRLLALVTEGETFRARAGSPSAQGSLPLGSSARGPAVGAPSRPAAPLSLAQQRAREIEARQASGEQPRVSGLAFGARPGPVSTTAGAEKAGSSETG